MQTRNRKIIFISLALGLIATLVSAGFIVVRPRLLKGADAIKKTVASAEHLTALINIFYSDKPHDVLLLIQNSNELRPTGGFITAIGEGTLTRGQLDNFELKASNIFDDAQKLKPELPKEMNGLISTPFLTIRDANWDVDFPTSAATLSKLYQSATDKNLPTVVAITTRANEKILELTGPITFTVNGQSFSVDQKNVTDTLQNLTDQEFASVGLEKEQRKEILAAYAKALLPKLISYSKLHPSQIFSAMQELTQTYDLQIWSKDPDLMPHVSALNLSQSVDLYPDSDALLIVDANLKSKKTDPHITQSVQLATDLSGENVYDTLTITYKNTASESFVTTDYKDFVRIYVPNGSELKSVEGLTNVATTSQHNRTIFSGSLIVPVGQERTIVLIYKVGNLKNLSADNYSLDLERQPGSRIYPVRLSVAKSGKSGELVTDNAQDRILKIDLK